MVRQIWRNLLLADDQCSAAVQFSFICTTAFQQLNWELLVGVMFGTVILYHSLVNAAAHDCFVMK